MVPSMLSMHQSLESMFIEARCKYLGHRHQELVLPIEVVVGLQVVVQSRERILRGIVLCSVPCKEDVLQPLPQRKLPLGAALLNTHSQSGVGAANFLLIGLVPSWVCRAFNLAAGEPPKASGHGEVPDAEFPTEKLLHIVLSKVDGSVNISSHDDSINGTVERVLDEWGCLAPC